MRIHEILQSLSVGIVQEYLHASDGGQTRQHGGGSLKPQGTLRFINLRHVQREHVAIDAGQGTIVNARREGNFYRSLMHRNQGLGTRHNVHYRGTICFATHDGLFNFQQLQLRRFGKKVNVRQVLHRVNCFLHMGSTRRPGRRCIFSVTVFFSRECKTLGLPLGRFLVFFWRC